jgi:hypothetical protein
MNGFVNPGTWHCHARGQQYDGEPGKKVPALADFSLGTPDSLSAFERGDSPSACSISKDGRKTGGGAEKRASPGLAFVDECECWTT